MKFQDSKESHVNVAREIQRYRIIQKFRFYYNKNDYFFYLQLKINNNGKKNACIYHSIKQSESSSSSSSSSLSSLHYLLAERIVKISAWRHFRRPNRLGTPAWSPGKLVGSPFGKTWWWPRGWQAPPACVGRQGRARRPRSSLKRPRVLQALLLQVRKHFTPKTASRLRDAPSCASLLLSASTGEWHPLLKGFQQTPVARDCREGRFPSMFFSFLLKRELQRDSFFTLLFSTFEEIASVASLKKGYTLF